jgi:hypothetical protein
VGAGFLISKAETVGEFTLQRILNMHALEHKGVKAIQLIINFQETPENKEMVRAFLEEEIS